MVGEHQPWETTLLPVIPKNPLLAAGMRKGDGIVTLQHPGTPWDTQGTNATLRVGGRTTLLPFPALTIKPRCLPTDRLYLLGRVTHPWHSHINPSILAGINWFNPYHAWHTSLTPTLEGLAQGTIPKSCTSPPHGASRYRCRIPAAGAR